MQRAHTASRKAIFLDRDGVLNRNVFYSDTRAWESPRSAEEFFLEEGVGQALRALRAAGFRLILVSNQPNAAKGKCTQAELIRIHERLVAELAREQVHLDAALYCHHHPGFTGACQCRKPSPYFLLQAQAQFYLQLGECWMVGDRATDMQCGRAAGVSTAWIVTGQETETPSALDVDLRCDSLWDAAAKILRRVAVAS